MLATGHLSRTDTYLSFTLPLKRSNYILRTYEFSSKWISIHSRLTKQIEIAYNSKLKSEQRPQIMEDGPITKCINRCSG